MASLTQLRESFKLSFIGFALFLLISNISSFYSIVFVNATPEGDFDECAEDPNAPMCPGSEGDQGQFRQQPSPSWGMTNGGLNKGTMPVAEVWENRNYKGSSLYRIFVGCTDNSITLCLLAPEKIKQVMVFAGRDCNVPPNNCWISYADLLTSGQSTADQNSNTQSTADQNSVAISIVPGSSAPKPDNKYYNPSPVNVAVGTTVTWTNNDATLHTATSGVFDSSYLTKGKTFQHTFDKAGTFDYYCTLHPFMKGRVIVGGAGDGGGGGSTTDSISWWQAEKENGSWRLKVFYSHGNDDKMPVYFEVIDPDDPQLSWGGRLDFKYSTIINGLGPCYEKTGICEMRQR